MALRKRTAEAVKQGRKLREIREGAGLRQVDVAKVMRTDPANVSAMEHGRQEPSLRQLRALARQLAVPPATLIV